MSPRTTRSLLVAVPVASWFLLVGITAGLSADGSPPQGGLFACSMGLVVTISLVAIALWSRADARAHVSGELQDVRNNLSQDLASFYQLMARRIDGVGERIEERLDQLDGPTQPIHLAAVASAPVPVLPRPAPALPPDNVLAFEMGRRIERETRR